MRRTSIAVLLVALAGCGGGGGDRSPKEVAREYVASDDASKCDDADLAFLERQTKRRGDEARATCRRNVEQAKPPGDVRVRSEKVTGDTAGVLVEAGGQEVVVRLRRDGDRWLVTGFE